ncbi:hypothetical protein EVAR_5985_1 [Eumeta japonica]|uniref:Uncharacterized protein n=1 Tax=Eumeta variegata TaxID=151549 RepID=A0A4C1T9E4_EUMVA|nr:hypothetical protein EVAR_5985_1 [Eumeta japonica]
MRYKYPSYLEPVCGTRLGGRAAGVTLHERFTRRNVSHLSSLGEGWGLITAVVTNERRYGVNDIVKSFSVSGRVSVPARVFVPAVSSHAKKIGFPDAVTPRMRHLVSFRHAERNYTFAGSHGFSLVNTAAITNDARGWCGMKIDVVARVKEGMLRWFGKVERVNESEVTK